MKFFSFFILLIVTFSAQAEDKVIRIYQDADLSNHAESSKAIQKGIEIAFDEIGKEIEGYKVEFKYLDHRSNVVRSKQNYETFLADPQALAIYSGNKPYSVFNAETNVNAHEALHSENYCMAQYGENDEILIINAGGE